MLYNILYMIETVSLILNQIDGMRLDPFEIH